MENILHVFRKYLHTEQTNKRVRNSDPVTPCLRPETRKTDSWIYVPFQATNEERGKKKKMERRRIVENRRLR